MSRRKYRRSVVTCMNCTRMIYVYTFGMGTSDHWCARCVYNRGDSTLEEFHKERKDQYGPMHKRHNDNVDTFQCEDLQVRN